MGSDYTIKPVEVVYRGFKFRSRHEARWAAFFDLCKWDWDYEPCDFNGWFPDFALFGVTGDRVYVEVKPFNDCREEDRKKINASGCRHECLILGQTPVIAGGTQADYTEARLGWLRERCGTEDSLGWTWEEASFFMVKADNGKVMGDFCSSTGSWTGRITGIHTRTRERTVIVTLNDVANWWGLAHEMTRYER